MRKRKTDVRAGAPRRRRAAASRRRAKGLLVSLQVKRDGRWKPIDRDRTTRRGRYVLRERVTPHGQHAAARPRRRRPRRRPSETRRVGKLRVYRWAYASWYGPGLYGNRTACGGTLGYGTLGVAHKSLPCGAKVTFKKGDREVTVPRHRPRALRRRPRVRPHRGDRPRLGFGGHGAVLVTR